MRGKSARSRRRRTARRLWPVLGLSVVGVGVAVAVAATRRRRLDTYEVPEAPPAGAEWESPWEPASAAAPDDTPAVWIAGPGGNLYVRDIGAKGVTGATGARGTRGAGAARGTGGAGEAGEAERGEGAGPTPVVFVHALAGNGGQWALQLDHLRGLRRAVALDLRGHGDSDPADDGDYGVDALAGDVAAVADQLALRRFVLVGHSLGGLVAIRYAGLHPGRVAGLLLADPNGDQSQVPAAEIAPLLAAIAANPLAEIEGYFRQLVVGGDREVSAWVLDDLRQTHEEALTAAVAAAARYSPRPDLARYGGPTLSVVSDMNSLPYSLHKLEPGLPVELMTGTGHWLMMDRPRVFNRILDDFLDRVDAGGG
jgi:pimeloyl-ACP methyl ester carboxylesterase